MTWPQISLKSAKRRSHFAVDEGGSWGSKAGGWEIWVQRFEERWSHINLPIFGTAVGISCVHKRYLLEG